MDKSTRTAAQILATAFAAAAAYAILPRPKRVRAGQVAVVTGGSSGLGLAIAHLLGQSGLKLVLAARSQDQLEIARTELIQNGSVADEDDVLLVACDVSDQHQAAGLIDLALQTFGSLDLLINNAGVIEVGPVESQPIAAYERAMATHFFAALYTTHAALPYLLEKQAGAIVNIASIGGKMAVPHLLPYCASKFALVGFSEGLHAELRAKGIRVTTVCPGLMRTGGENHAHFTGQEDKEKAWFQWSARTPVVAATATHAAHKIVSAVNAGRAELTITPQAWLAARFAGLAPETTQVVASFVNHYLLPTATPKLAGQDQSALPQTA